MTGAPATRPLPPEAPLPRDLEGLLRQAQARRDANDWAAALKCYSAALALKPGDPVLHHNLAMGHHALGQHRKAVESAALALRAAPALWQSAALAARAHLALGEPEAADRALATVLAANPGNGIALLDRAGLVLNEFGDPAAARALVAPLLADPALSGDAELATIMTLLYDRGTMADEELTGRVRRFSQNHLRLPAGTAKRPSRRAGRRKRVLVVSPLLSGSPVYHFAFSTLEALSRIAELIFVTRGLKSDWATDRFRSLATEWHEAAPLDAAGLASLMASIEADAVLDLGGWSDPVALRALSAGVAPAIYKWVGGQSITTGLDNVTAWIGDAWHCPVGCEDLYSEPVLRVAGGYVDYTRPPVMAEVERALPLARRGTGLVGNPAKIGAALMANWPAGVGEVLLIDRRYAFAQVRERVESLLAERGVRVSAVVVPGGHREYLAELGKLEHVIVTRPYSAGLTAVEALTLGVKLLSAGNVGRIFSERHHLTHLATGGANPNAPAAICRLIEEL